MLRYEKHINMNAAVIVNLDDIDPNSVAAIFYRPKDDVDRLLADFEKDIAQQGVRMTASCSDTRGAQRARTSWSQSTLPQDKRSRFRSHSAGEPCLVISIQMGLPGPAAVISQAVRKEIDLLVINKFGRQEAAGRLRAEFIDAIARPVLTALPKKCLADWRTFTAGVGTLLPCDRQPLEQGGAIFQRA